MQYPRLVQFLLLDNKTNINNKNDIKKKMKIKILSQAKKNLGPSKPYEVPVHIIKSSSDG